MKVRQAASNSCSPVRQRGFVLVTMALSAVAVFGVVGLAVDVGRMFIAKNELQVYSDAGALDAAMALDGTTTGIAQAAGAVAASANKWDFGTAGVSGPSVTFAIQPTGPWLASPNPATGYSFVRVSASASVRLYFLPVVTGQ